MDASCGRVVSFEFSSFYC